MFTAHCSLWSDRFADSPPQLLTDEPENEITLTAFRLLTMDLLALFPVMNEGAINALGELLYCIQYLVLM